MKILKICLVVLAIISSEAGSFFYGQQQGYSQGYSHGHDIGWDDAKKNYNVDNPPKSYFFEYENLKGDYNKLLEDYNKLVKEANAALSRPIFQPRQSVNCTSNTIGTYAYTNCY